MKHHNVLTLNKSYQPVHIIIWEEAMKLLIKEHAHPLDREYVSYPFSDWLTFSISQAADDYDKIKTVKQPIAIPEIVVLTRYNHLPDRDVKYSHQSVFSRDGYICQYCRQEFTKKELTADHVIPRASGGKTTWDNIVACCRLCNEMKADRSLEMMNTEKVQQDLQLRYPHVDVSKITWHLPRKPRKPKWISPLSNVSKKVYICRSWAHFMNRIDSSQDEY